MQRESSHSDRLPSDGSLLRLVRSGEQAAATDLYVRYAERLLRLAKRNTGPHLATRFDPEDVVQSVFRTFFRRVGEGAYDVPPGEELWRLLLVLALNKVRSLANFHLAQKRDAGSTRSMSTDLENGWPLSIPDPQPEQILEMVVTDVLEEMPAGQRGMVEQRIRGDSVVEIAAQTNRSRRTVERVLQKFRDRIEKLGDHAS